MTEQQGLLNQVFDSTNRALRITGGGSTSVKSTRHMRTAGDISCNNLAWTDLQSATDLTLAAVAGDVVEVSVGMVVETAATDLYFDVATIVSAAVVNSFSGGASFGFTGWYCPSSRLEPVSGSVQYVVQAGDISGGNVVLRLRFKNGSGVARTVYADATIPLFWSAKNLGQ